MPRAPVLKIGLIFVISLELIAKFGMLLLLLESDGDENNRKKRKLTATGHFIIKLSVFIPGYINSAIVIYYLFIFFFSCNLIFYLINQILN